MRASVLGLISSACIVSGAALVSFGTEPDLPTVERVDLRRYQGKWFEIARLPNRFEDKCAGDVTAEYKLRQDGRVQVINTCREANGRLRVAKGVAKRKDAQGSSSRLKVTFFWPFSGDYWILDLDTDYRWAMVGTPDRKYLWILSRQPNLPTLTYDRLLAKARSLHFDTNRVVRTIQTGRRNLSL